MLTFLHRKPSTTKSYAAKQLPKALIRLCDRFPSNFLGNQMLPVTVFELAYITQLWKDSKDIEFVKQSIGHQKLDTTSAYINKLSNQERQERISRLE